MNENDPITIRQVNNGFMVYNDRSHMTGGFSDQDTYVFQTFKELSNFMEKHFQHREKKVLSDD